MQILVKKYLEYKKVKPETIKVDSMVNMANLEA